MQIPVTSNIVTGIYTLIEFILVLVLTEAIAQLVGAWNIKTIYNDRKKIRLTESFLSFISDHGLSTRNIHIVSSTAFVLIACLLSAGSFSLVGVTVPEYSKQSVKYLVTRAPPAYRLNVSQHVKATSDGVLISAELALLKQHFLCHKLNQQSSIYYEYVYDGEEIHDVATPEWITTKFFNVTCTMHRSKYRETIALNKRDSLPRGGRTCSMNLSIPEILPQRQLIPGFLTSPEDCFWRVVESWCFADKPYLYCAALLHGKVGYTVLTLSNGSGSFSVSTSIFVEAERPLTEDIQSIALLLSLQLLNSPSSYWTMLSLYVQRNATVYTKVNRDVTRVDLKLFKYTLIPALSLFFVTMVLSSLSWLVFIALPGRRQYNCFRSAMDMLSCAAVEKFNSGGCRFRHKANIIVGTDENGDHATPVRVRYENKQEKVVLQ